MSRRPLLLPVALLLAASCGGLPPEPWGEGEDAAPGPRDGAGTGEGRIPDLPPELLPDLLDVTPGQDLPDGVPDRLADVADAMDTTPAPDTLDAMDAAEVMDLSDGSDAGCVPDCEGKSCGGDGCGGSCGDCPPHKPLCTMAFTCAACVPDCEDKVCGDDGCGESCGSCPPGWVCVAGACPPPACTQDLTLFEESFQGCNDGALQVLDDQPEDPVTWQSFKDGAFSPPCGLMLGDPVSGTYDTGDPVSLTLALPAVDVPPGPDPFLVRFAVRMDAEPVVDPLYPYDHDVLYLRAYGEGLPAGGEVLFHSKEFLNSTGGQWRLAAATLSPWGGKTLQLRFEFDTLDSVDNAYAGAALDDLRVGTACPLCALDSDCDDGDPCSTDLCVLFSNQPGWGTCGHLPRPECCIPLDPSFCDDLDPCTLDSCDPLTGDCVHVPAEDCSE